MAEYLSIAVLALVLFVPGAWAQQTDPRVNPPAAPQKPLPSGESSPKGSGEAGGAPGTEATPDTRSLSGAEQFTLGQLSKSRSYMLAGFQIFEAGDTNVDVTIRKSHLVSSSTLMGHIGVHRVRGRYQFTTEYRGGGILYVPRHDLNTHIHDFGLSQTIMWRRWSLVLRDQFSYFPEASFGFGVGQIATGTILSDLNPIFVPNQTILTARANRISNTAAAELRHTLSRKSSFNVSASYGILQFVKSPGFTNSRDAVFLVGYDYAPSARNTLGLSYGFSLFRFGAQRQQIYNHILHAAYGRRITGRLALELSAGPELYVFKNNPGPGSGNRLSWGVESALLYRWPNTRLRIAHASFLSGGGGVLTGAQTHQVVLTAERRLSRAWQSTLDLGFAHNNSLRETTPTTPGTGNLAFNTVFGGVGLRRLVGRHMQLSLFYRADRQTVPGGFCTISTVNAVTTCSNLPVRHHFNLGLEWHNRQVSLD